MNNKLELYISALALNEEDIRGKAVVVIDVLRASSTIVTAINNGARGIIPVTDMEMAGKISQGMNSPHYLLCGENNGQKIEGYHLGNSPLEYSADTVKDKTIILNTTNGTKAVQKTTLAKQVVIGCFLNLSQTVHFIEQTPHPVALVCAGWRGRLAFEDLLCAGQIIYELNGGQQSNHLTDTAKIAFGCFKKYGDDVEQALKASDHAKRLEGKMDPNDIAHCSSTNKLEILPALNDGIISDFNGKEKEIGGN